MPSYYIVSHQTDINLQQIKFNTLFYCELLDSYCAHVELYTYVILEYIRNHYKIRKIYAELQTHNIFKLTIHQIYKLSGTYRADY